MMKKIPQKKFLFTSLVLGIVLFGAYAFTPPVTPPQQEEQKWESNLKVLPKDISHDDLIAIMKSYSRALGYKCGDCHAKSEQDPTKLDFASYKNHHKTRALEMMKMVERINKKEFGIKGKFADNYLNNSYKVTCYSCHHGQSHPALDAPKLPENPEK